jgi:hypothetical protein
VKMDQHGGAPFRTSLRTDLAMNRADRRGEMLSPWMEHLISTQNSSKVKERVVYLGNVD